MLTANIWFEKDSSTQKFYNRKIRIETHDDYFPNETKAERRNREWNYILDLYDRIFDTFGKMVARKQKHLSESGYLWVSIPLAETKRGESPRKWARPGSRGCYHFDPEKPFLEQKTRWETFVQNGFTHV